MNNVKLRLAFFVASICLCVSSWAERVAPTFPTFTTLESGKNYYLYNVGTGKFLNRSTVNNSHLGVGTYGAAITITQTSNGSYTMRFADGTTTDYLYAVASTTSSKSNFDSFCYFAIKDSLSGYVIQRSTNNTSYYVANEYVGYADGATNDRIVPNLTTGNIIWQLMETAEAERYFAKHKLYMALEASDIYNYPTEYYEAIYEDKESTTEELENAAATLNNGVALTQKYQSPEWSDYTVLFGEGVFLNTSSIGTKTIYNLGETTSITATINVDKNATLIYEKEPSSTMPCSVYIDGEMVRTFQAYASYKFFESLSVGSHHIEWRFENNLGYQQNGRIINIGIANTPAAISVSLLEPGSLGTEVLNHVDHIKDVRCLKVSGKMNDDDWAKINMMTNLQSLDLSDAIVTKIPDLQFKKTDEKWQFLHKIELPNILEIIGNDAFYKSHVETLTFPSTLKEIGSFAFYDSKITEAILPDNMTNIGKGAFEYCHFLVSVNYPNGLNYVPDNCFYNCENLNTFELHNGITRIGESAFGGTKNFNASLPETLTTLGCGAFSNAGTVNLVVPEALTVWEKSSSSNSGFSSNKKLISAEFPTSFYQVDVRGILDYCEKLETVTFKSPTVVAGEYKNSFLYGCTSPNLTLRVPSFLVNSYKLDEYWYNYNIEGFNTADIKDWNVRGNLVLNNRERIDGTPNLIISKTGSVKINGENEQNIDNLEINVDHVTRIKDEVTKEYDYAFGNMLVNNDATTISGECVHHHKVDAKKWYFVSLPFDIKVNEITNNSEARMAFRYYDGATRASEGVVGNWKDYAEDAVIEAGTGFIVQTSVATTLTFRALDNESKQNIVSNEEFKKALATNASESLSDKGWNLVGNPWQCYFNIHTLNFTAPITVYDVYNKTYAAYSIIDDDYAIRPNEAFFVQCPEGTEFISFPQNGRQLTNVITNQSAARPMYSQASSRQLIDITVSADKYTDKTRVVLNETSTLGYETSYDACKFMTMENGVPQIYTIDSEETEYAINERPLDKGIVKLGVVVSTSGTHRISMPRNEAGSVILIDHKAGVKYDLSKGDYEFTAEAGTYNSRFTLNITSSSETGIEDAEMAEGALECDGNNILVNGIKGNVSVYTVDGRKVAETYSNGNVSFNNMPQGIYIVRTVQGTGKVTVK
ncbi:MAG: leucine-rich repeat domain-containing protein [Bacteroidaceae bacterium]|nr:leucine-rich repeat domain-containing protein [Bacteroidaceae bacterium]